MYLPIKKLSSILWLVGLTLISVHSYGQPSTACDSSANDVKPPCPDHVYFSIKEIQYISNNGYCQGYCEFQLSINKKERMLCQWNPSQSTSSSGVSVRCISNNN
jgi:hypothetical protein